MTSSSRKRRITLHETGPRSAAAALVGILEAAGIERVFGIPGGPISPVIDALLDSPIELITCQQESMAVYAAAGHARASGRPGIVLVTSGPGILSAVTGIAAALCDESPVVVLAGEVATSARGRGALQDGSEAGLAVQAVLRTLTKDVVAVTRSSEIAARTVSALATASTAPCGPVVLTLPTDLSNEMVAPARVLVAPSPPSPVADDVIDEAAAHLLAAARPLIVLGGAAVRSGAHEPLRALAESAGIPVATDLEAKGGFPESHPLSLGLFGAGGDGRAKAYLEQGADTVLLIGARLDDTMTANFSPALLGSRVTIQLDHQPARLSRAYPVTLAAAGDLRDAIARLADAIARRRPRTPSLPSRAIHEFHLGAAPFDPRSAIVALDRAFPDAVYSCDIGNHLLFAAMGLQLDDPERFHASMGLGGMGSGIGRALGLQLAHGSERQVIALCGDGGALMSGGEIATCARHGIPVVFAVFNDGQLGMVRHGSEVVYGRSHDWATPATDFAALARAMGGRAVRIDSLDDIASVGSSRDRRGPLVLDIPIDAEVRLANPRDEVLNFSKPTSEKAAS